MARRPFAEPRLEGQPPCQVHTTTGTSMLKHVRIKDDDKSNVLLGDGIMAMVASHPG